MIERLIILFVLLAVVPVAEARMYQWQDPDSGITHLSGTPPAWYRTGHGPRVIVFEKGEVIDDTSIELPEDKNEDLRLQAIARAEEDREIARQKAMAAEEMKNRLEGSGKPAVPEDMDNESMVQAPEEETTMAKDETESPDDAAATGSTEEEMRALIQAWEKSRAEQAMQAIQGGDN